MAPSIETAGHVAKRIRLGRSARCVTRCADWHFDEDGQLTLVTVITVLSMVVLAGFIGNVGHVVTKKMETQNAADTVALTSAQWMARGMNAVTATNHLLGEATALATVIEAIGGPEVDEGMKDYPEQSRILDELIRGFRVAAPIKPSIYTPPPLPNIDQQIVQRVIDLMVPKTKRIANTAHSPRSTIRN